MKSETARVTFGLSQVAVTCNKVFTMLPEKSPEGYITSHQGQVILFMAS